MVCAGQENTDNCLVSIKTQPNTAVFCVSVSIMQGSFIPGSTVSCHFNFSLTHLFACISHKQPRQHNFSPLTLEGYWQCDGV